MKPELIRAYIDQLAREPENFDMGVGVQGLPQSWFARLRGEPCGTVCCLAGRVYLNVSPAHTPAKYAPANS